MLNRIIILFALLSTCCFATEIPVCSEKECYTIVNELGEGAFGKVYSVEDTQGNMYAMKLYKNADNKTLLGQAKREFERGQVFHHRNIIHSIDLFKSPEEAQYLILEFVDGKNIGNVTSTTKKQTLRACRQLVKTLKYAYSHEYVYLDLHQGNVMINEKTDIKIVDLASFFSFAEISNSFSNETSLQDLDIKKLLEKKPELNNKLKKLAIKTNDFALKAILEWNFGQIVEMCLGLVKSSNMKKNDKIELMAKIQSIGWDYTESAKEGTEYPTEYYYDQLIDAL